MVDKSFEWLFTENNGRIKFEIDLGLHACVEIPYLNETFDKMNKFHVTFAESEIDKKIHV